MTLYIANFIVEAQVEEGSLGLWNELEEKNITNIHLKIVGKL
jgi:hypothetical protein